METEKNVWNRQPEYHVAELLWDLYIFWKYVNKGCKTIKNHHKWTGLNEYTWLLLYQH